MKNKERYIFRMRRLSKLLCPRSEGVCFIGIWFILSSWLLSNVTSVPFHRDEGAWIYTAHYFDLFLKSDGDSPEWKHPLALRDGPLPRYLIGAGLHLAGYDLKQILSLPLAQQDRCNLKTDGVIAEECRILLVARKSIALFAPAAVFLMMQIGNFLGGPLTAAFAGFLYVSSPLIQQITLRATGDGLLAFFLLLCLWFSIRVDILKSPIVVTSISCGLIFGLGTAAKLTTALCVPAFFLTLSIESYLKSGKFKLKQMQLLVKIFTIVLGFTWLFFVRLIPGVWHHPFSGVSDFFTLTLRVMRVQAQAWGAGDYVPYRLDRFQIAVEKTLGWSEARPWFLVGSDLKMYVLHSLCLVFGLDLGTRHAFPKVKRASETGGRPTLYVLVWTAVVFTGVSWNLILQVNRYLLPVLIVFIPWIALGYSVAVQRIFKSGVLYSRKVIFNGC